MDEWKKGRGTNERNLLAGVTAGVPLVTTIQNHGIVLNHHSLSLNLQVAAFLEGAVLPVPSETFLAAHTHTHNCIIHTHTLTHIQKHTMMLVV